MQSAASLRNPRGAPRQAQQTASGYPIGKVLPRSQRRAGKAAAKRTKDARCGSETGSKPAACRPCHAGSPGTPAHAHPPRSSSPGVFARSSPTARPPCRPGTHSLSGSPLPSLHDPRGCCCTGSRLPAALPALGALRHCSGKCAAAGSCQGLRGRKGQRHHAATFLRITVASVIRNCTAIAGPGKALRMLPGCGAALV